MAKAKWKNLLKNKSGKKRAINTSIRENEFIQVKKIKKDKRRSKITLVGVVKNNISTKNIIKKKTYQLRNWQRVYFWIK